MSKILARVLVSTVVASAIIEPNQLIQGTEEQLKPFIDSGSMSTDEKGVAWCKEQGAEPIDFPEAKPEPSSEPKSTKKTTTKKE